MNRKIKGKLIFLILLLFGIIISYLSIIKEECELCNQGKDKDASCCHVVKLKGVKKKLKFYDYHLSRTVGILENDMGKYPYDFDNISFKDGDIVIDIGGNIGMTSIYLIKKFPFLKIFAFEPVKSNYKNFERNLIINKIPKNKIIVHNLGLTKDSRDIYMKFDENNSGGSQVINYNNTINNTQEMMNESIKSITLDQIFEKYKISKCKLLKVDCEGCEFEVIYSTKIGNLAKCENLRIEVHHNSLEKMKELINYAKNYIKSIEYYLYQYSR